MGLLFSILKILKIMEIDIFLLVATGLVVVAGSGSDGGSDDGGGSSGSGVCESSVLQGIIPLAKSKT